MVLQRRQPRRGRQGDRCRHQGARQGGRARPPTTSRSCSGCLVVVGDTEEEARAKRALARQPCASPIAASPPCRSPPATTRRLSSEPTPRSSTSPESNASKSGRQRVIDRARRDNLTVRQLAHDRRQLWRRSRWSGPPQDDRRPDGGNGSSARPATGSTSCSRRVPGGLDEFVDRVVPEMRSGAGCVRTEYEGRTLARKPGPAAAWKTGSSQGNKLDRGRLARILRKRAGETPAVLQGGKYLARHPYAALGAFTFQVTGDAPGVVTGSVLQGMAMTVPFGGLTFLVIAVIFGELGQIAMFPMVAVACWRARSCISCSAATAITNHHPGGRARAGRSVADCRRDAVGGADAARSSPCCRPSARS